MIKLEAYTGKDLQNFVSILTQFIHAGESNIANVKNKVESEVAKKFGQPSGVVPAKNSGSVKLTAKVSTICERCGAKAVMKPVNISRCTMTGDKNDKTSIECTNTACLHTKYSNKTIQELRA